MTTTFEPTTFGQESAHVLALDSVVSGLESLERQSRAIEAERLRLLAESLGIATAESERAQASSPQGRRAELAYRSVRAEVAAALHLSEATIEQMGQRIFEAILRHASGEKTRSEAIGLGRNEFVPWPIGVTD